jgi:hypothetical protein
VLLALSVLVAGVLAASASDGSTHYDPLTAEAGSLSHGSGHNPVPFAPQGERASDLDLVLAGVVGAKNTRMSSHVARLAQAEREARAGGETIDALSLSRLDPDLQAMAELRLMRIDGQGRLQAYVLVATTVDEVVADVKRAQGQVERFDESAGIVQALVPIGHLEALAHRTSVGFVRLPDYGFPQAGSVTTEGDSILRADAVRSTFGVDGTGVRVGVISDGVGGLAASQASGDLPAVNITTCNVVPSSDPTLSGAEGTAMLEIVHDLAPGAELWFGHFGFGTHLDFNAVVDCLAANTDVVVDDVGWFNVGPYDGTSSVSANTSTELNRASNPIRAYANAVGNEALSHYQETYVQFSPTITLHRFAATATTTDAFGIGPTPIDPMFLVSGGIAIVILQWNDPFGASSNDYDLALFRDSDLELVAFSGNQQTGSQDPTEVVAFQNTGTSGFFDIVIDKFAGGAKTFDLFIICFGCVGLPNGNLSEPIHNFNTLGSSVPNQSDAGGGVISAGAINASDPGNDDIAFYSSRGPTNDSRIKPDITGIDCVSVTGGGGLGSPFCGTSAAAPHIAGIAALLLECNPALLAGEPGDSPSGDRTALRDALLNNAVDLGAGGVDNTYGYGRADASASSAAICADTDGDGVFDTIDNCPAWPNAGQALPPWPVPADDPDCDGFTTTIENWVGTLPDQHCGDATPNNESPQPWPTDNNDNTWSMLDDALRYIPVFNTFAPGPPYDQRFDLNADGGIGLGDVLKYIPVINKSCAP